MRFPIVHNNRPLLDAMHSWMKNQHGTQDEEQLVTGKSLRRACRARGHYRRKQDFTDLTNRIPSERRDAVRLMRWPFLADENDPCLDDKELDCWLRAKDQRRFRKSNVIPSYRSDYYDKEMESLPRIGSRRICAWFKRRKS